MNRKDREILDDRQYGVNRRDVGAESREELIRDGLDKNLPLERLSWYGLKDRALMKAIRERTETQFTFFWETESPFSQWHKSPFTSSEFFHIGLNPDLRGYIEDSFSKESEFSSVEQFMMYHKAVTFLDREIANSIMQTSNTRKIKELGRQVKNYNQKIWEYYRSNIVYTANKAKFEQNPNLMDALTATAGTTLVEAAPNDKIWGIGLVADDPKAQQRQTWEGKNLLGEILTLLRMEFMGEY